MLTSLGLDGLFRAVGVAYWSLMFAAIGLALWRAKTKTRKVFWSLAFFALFTGPIVPQVYRAHEFHERYLKAQALFEERCKTAGEKVYKTVEGVEGVFLVNGRRLVDPMDQFDPNDPAGDGAYGEGYIETFLLGRNAKQRLIFSYQNNDGAYRFVEMSEGPDQGVMHYFDRGDGKGIDHPFRLDMERRTRRTARYGIRWTDISTNEDRDRWIAGSRIEVLDLDTQQILAERTGYIVDLAQGSKGGGRQPWNFAQYNACPPFPVVNENHPENFGLTRDFAQNVLRPTSGGTK